MKPWINIYKRERCDVLLSRLDGNLVLLPRLSAIKSDNSRQILRRRGTDPAPPRLARFRLVSAPSSSSVTSPPSSVWSAANFLPCWRVGPTQSAFEIFWKEIDCNIQGSCVFTNMMILPISSSGVVRVRGLSLDLKRADPKRSLITRAADFCCGIEQWFSKWMNSGYLIQSRSHHRLTLFDYNLIQSNQKMFCFISCLLGSFEGELGDDRHHVGEGDFSS